MPSSAIDTFVTLELTARLKTTDSWVLKPSITSYSVFPRTQSLACPATTSNPMVSGHRKMAAWNKRWFRGYCPPTSADITHFYNGYSTRREYSNQPIWWFPKAASSGLYWDAVTRLVPFSTGLQFSADNAARTAVLNKVGQKKWDLGVSALELKQTAGLVGDLAQGLAKTVENLINSKHSARQRVDEFFRSVREHGSFDKAAEQVAFRDTQLLETLKDRWMQYQFGIKPAYMDVGAAVEYLATRVLKDGVPMLVYGKAGHESRDSYMGTARTEFGFYRTRPRLTETCQVHYSLIYEMPTGGVRDITSLGLDNPWNIAWEVTQLSWMVDYVVGMGDWLQSFTATKGLVFREGCKSTLRRVVSTEFVMDRLPPTYGRLVVDKAPRSTGAFLERGDFSREVLTRGLTPAVVPQIKSSLGLVQMANSLFALSNVFSGKRIYR